MKFTFNWLKEFVEVTAGPQELAKLLTMAGLEVESLAPQREAETNAEDWLLEIAVTPNRGDCLGIAGIAREVAALTGGKLLSVPSSPAKKDSTTSKRISLIIEDPRLCPRYSARIVDEVEISAAPAWLRYRIESCGIRAINNVVDITNYVMLETGQPLHAFDLDRLPAKQIVVKAAGGVKKFTTLDGVERELTAEDLLICDGETPVALAGVMGGMDSEVRASTRSILLESANFAPTSIRRTAKRLALRSEASHRFERGVDPEGTIAALNRAVYLLIEHAGAKAMAGVADRYPGRAKAPTILLREERIEKLLGLELGRKQVEKLLRSLGMKTEQQGRSDSLKVIPPTSRPDIWREADVIEELARVHGYDRIPTTLPLVRCSGGKHDSRLGWERKLRSLLAGEGMTEVINLPFTSEALNRTFVGPWESAPAPVAVLNPLAKENAEMRGSLLPGLLDNLRLNLAYQARSFWVYHLGKVFRSTAGGESTERQCVAGLLYGARPRYGLRLSEESPVEFLDCKGLVEAVLDLFRVRELVSWSATAPGVLHPGRSASLRYGGTELGYLGQLHPDVCDQLAVPPVLLFELDFEKLLQYAPRRITTRALPRFPAVERDVAIVVDRDFASQQIVSWIQNLGEALIEHVEVFDQYVGAPIPETKKSLAYKISYRAEDRTLTDSEINELHQSLVDRLGKTFGAERRS
ncbi:MAG TPA: phenylalanine--tRNA ligase subunit beta [Candidatus Binatia bacterium]|jgi:phenylalanyl-tRNA synthetase beta chain|nr:phenylalanine--tRNA ligase subunit beta [Candidatus Binatia bacterium]